nr:hypothetical protein [uncultured Caproiciproducens sp.]
MAVLVSDVLKVWTDRGYVPADPSATDTAKYTSYINQAKDSICGYCRLPLAMTALPDGLLYPWAEIAYSIMKGGVFQQSSGSVKSVSEGDTSVTFNTDINKATAPTVDYSAALNAFRCLF